MTAITHVIPSNVFNGLRKNPDGTTELLKKLLLERYVHAMVGTPDLERDGRALTLDSEEGRNHAISMMDISVVPDVPNFTTKRTEIYIPLAAFDALIGENHVLRHALMQRLLERLGEFSRFSADKYFVSPMGDGTKVFTPTGISSIDLKLQVYPVIADKGGGFVHTNPLLLLETTQGIMDWLRDDMHISGIGLEGIATDHEGHVHLGAQYNNLVVASGYDKPHRTDPNGPFQEHIRSQVKGAVEDLLGLSGVQGIDRSVRLETDFQARERYHFA